MATAAVDEFSVWLGNKLQALNTDENIFGSYISGILDGDDSVEEKTEAIEELLAEIVIIESSLDISISAICKEIIEMWQKSHPADNIEAAGGGASCSSSSRSRDDVDKKLVRMLESQSLATTVQKEYTAEEKKIRDAILAQYSQMTDDEDEMDEECSGGGATQSGCGASGGGGENSLERNTNAFSVQQAEKEKREQARIDSQKKKDKDKEDREKQKQMKEEKKEKRKTQKGERRR